jgi:tetratricopeptide (TPR) repeat protein
MEVSMYDANEFNQESQQFNQEQNEDFAFLMAEPISRKRMDLLWLDPPRLTQLKQQIEKHKTVILVLGDESEMRKHTYSLEDYQWAKQIEEIIDKAYSAGNQNKYNESLLYYKQALQSAPGCDLFLMSIGVCYASLGQKQKALMYLERAAQISPGNTRIRENLAEVRLL